MSGVSALSMDPNLHALSLAGTFVLACLNLAWIYRDRIGSASVLCMQTARGQLRRYAAPTQLLAAPLAVRSFGNFPIICSHRHSVRNINSVSFSLSLSPSCFDSWGRWHCDAFIEICFGRLTDSLTNSDGWMDGGGRDAAAATLAAVVLSSFLLPAAVCARSIDVDLDAGCVTEIRRSRNLAQKTRPQPSPQHRTVAPSTQRYARASTRSQFAG